MLRNSTVSAALGSNYTPTPTDVFTIKEIISEGETRLDRLDCEISQVEAALERLAAERTALRENIDNHRKMISPIRFIPREILARIFEQYISPLDFDESLERDPSASVSSIIPRSKFKTNGLSSTPGPLIFGQVCTYWRDLALNTPRLWNTLALRVLGGYIAESFIAGCEAWLKRSGALPLSLWIEGKSDLIIRVMNAVMIQHCDRWEFVTLHAPMSSIARVCSSLSPGALPMLKSFSLFDDTWRAPLGTVDEWVALKSAPALHQVDLDFRQGGSILRHSFCWSQLTHLAMRFPEPKDCLHILRQASALVTCYIWSLEKRRTGFQNTPCGAIVLHYLHFLHISTSDPTSLMIFRVLTCPALQKLHIQYTKRNGGPSSQHSIQPFWHLDLVTFLSRTSGSVEDLTIRGFSDVELTECLSALPKLTALSIEEISDSRIINAFMKALTSGPESANSLVPHLTSLQISSSESKDPINGYAVVKMVDWRCYSVPFKTLKCLSLKGSMTITEAELDRLKKALGDGLDVRELRTTPLTVGTGGRSLRFY